MISQTCLDEEIRSNREWSLRISYGIVVVSIAVLLLALLVTLSEPGDAGTPSLFTLDNHRSTDRIVLDIESMEIEVNEKIQKGGFTSMVTADVDRDGNEEVYYIIDNRVFRYDTGNGIYSELFRKKTGSSFRTIQFHDVDRDGSVECILFDHGLKQFRCLDPRSEVELWNVSAQSGRNEEFKVLDVGEEVLIYFITALDEVRCISGDGEPIWSKPFPENDERMHFSIGDLDNDGTAKLVIGELLEDDLENWSFRISVLDLLSSEVLKSSAISLGDYPPAFSAPPLIDDIDRSSTGAEIAFGITGYGILLVESSNLRSMWQIPNSELTSTIIQFETLTTDYGTFLIACENYVNVYVIHGDSGIIHWQLFDEQIIAHQDYLWVGDFNPRTPGDEVLISSVPSLSIYNPTYNDREVLFNPSEPEQRGFARVVFTANEMSQVDSLHLFYTYRRERLGYHYQFVLPTDPYLEVTSDIFNKSIHPNLPYNSRDFIVNAPDDQISSMVLDFYVNEGHSSLFINDSSWQYHPTSDIIRISNGDFSTENGGMTKISFTISMNWKLPTGTPIDVVVTVSLQSGKWNSFRFNRAFLYINELVVVGELTVHDQSGRSYGPFDWMTSNLKIELSNVSLKFNGSSSAPKVEDIILSIQPTPDTQASFKVTTDGSLVADVITPFDYNGNLQISMMIVQGTSNQRFSYEMEFQVDGTPPVILGTLPEDDAWYNTGDHLFGCLVTDGTGSGLSNVELIIKGDDGNVIHRSPPGIITEREGHSEAIGAVKLDEGEWTVIWSLWDIAGNGPVLSDAITIRIDTTAVVFSEFHPKGWSNDTTVNIQLIVSDNGGSGVDLATVTYSYSLDGLFTFCDWKNMDTNGVTQSKRVELELTFDEGTMNFVRFRAADIVGNTRYSLVYRVLVDINGPVIDDYQPSMGSTIDPAPSYRCSVNVSDDISGVDPSTIHYSIATDEGEFSQWYEPQVDPLDSGRFYAIIEAEAGSIVAIKWMAEDLARTKTSSDEISFRVNGPPVISKVQPASDSHFIEGTTIKFLVEADDPDEDDFSITWQTDDTILGNSSSFSMDLDPGRYHIELTLDDHHGNVVGKTLVIEVDEEFDYYINRAGPYIIILVIIIAFIISGVLWTRRHHRNT